MALAMTLQPGDYRYFDGQVETILPTESPDARQLAVVSTVGLTLTVQARHLIREKAATTSVDPTMRIECQALPVGHS